jgi:hypothetical protein
MRVALDGEPTADVRLFVSSAAHVPLPAGTMVS